MNFNKPKLITENKLKELLWKRVVIDKIGGTNFALNNDLTGIN